MFAGGDQSPFFASCFSVKQIPNKTHLYPECLSHSDQVTFLDDEDTEPQRIKSK